MSDTKRQLENVVEFAIGAVVGILGLCFILAVTLWPMVLWVFFGESIILAMVITIVWLAAIV